MKPLAYLMRPKSFSDIVGQDALVGENGVINLMVKNKKITSFILYGNPGCGKTTIAEAVCFESNLPYFKFNASTDNKDYLKQIISESRFNPQTIVIIDEIHRMKKDIQDYLLPTVESGQITIIGLTTVNPYHSVNPAIRSRVSIYRLKDLKENDLKTILLRAKQIAEYNGNIDDEVMDYLVKSANLEIRTLINSFEVLTNTCTGDINLAKAKEIIGKPGISVDSNGDNYYDILSGLQKSIRGSDVDASLHYLAKLIAAEDLEIICRRLLAIAYEDVSLANPGIGPRVVAACDAARQLGFPEARLPLATITVEMALSPKSNSAMLAVDKALKDVEDGKGGSLPIHLKNISSFDPDQKSYKYPHDYPNAWVDQQYMPDTLVGTKYYKPKPTSKSEISLYNRYMEIEEYKKK